MVNKSPRYHISRILKEAEGPVSGEAISERLGISRVAVWKHVQKMQQLGYPVEATSRGYRLARIPDSIHPWEFAEREDRIHYYPVIDSTMNAARHLARGGCPDVTVVLAERQERGRGRLNRTWISADGGLYFTVVLRRRLPAALSYRINFAASLELALFLIEDYRLDAAVKWPNDVRIAGRKVAGILSEMETEADMITYVNLGIGLNVNNPLPPDVAAVTSVQSAFGAAVSRRRLLSGFLDRLETRMETIDRVNPVTGWKQLTDTLNRPVKIVTVKDTVEGIAVDVDQGGALMVRQPDGTTRSVVYGDCFYGN